MTWMLAFAVVYVAGVVVFVVGSLDHESDQVERRSE